MEIYQAQPAIDLTRFDWVRELGDLRLYGTWLYTPQDDNSDEYEPCLVLVPANRRYGFKPCVVALSAAYKYTDPRHLAAVSLEFAKALGFDSNPMTAANKIGGVIHDHLLDLIKMPENPAEAVVGAYGQINDGHRTRTVEILDHVSIPQI